ncbi:FIST N-terminal domain-containing protein [Rhodovulum sp. DZ06]|uniref:FIST N-terminal domain-containing protein n=1 Tax=Rhodovulum sp. DZ06 TaxID=3425126 RepID=UPI003D33532E
MQRVDATAPGGRPARSSVGEPPLGKHVRQAWTAAADPEAATRDLARGLGDGPFALILLFVSPDRDRAALSAALEATPVFAAGPVIGCTTAGEITSQGYDEGCIVAVGLPAADFSAAVAFVPDLESYQLDRGRELVQRLRMDLAAAPAAFDNEFAVLMADGLSLREDALVASLGPSLGATQLIGGSAADALDFSQTAVLHDGRFHGDAAVLALVRTRMRVEVFRFDNYTPTERRMVVTAADPEQRLVSEINAEPAAREYARLVGKDPEQLSPLTFAAHPVVVRVGGQHHVRSIQRIEETGELRFFSAIDEGLVLTVADALDIAEHLDEALSALNEAGAPDAILGFDCALRRIEVEQSQLAGRVSEILSRHGVVGFNTFGEQHNMLHVNQTFTGVALYPPACGAEAGPDSGPGAGEDDG